MPSRTTRRRPIQLAALRGFEAAARLLSFTLAAGELNLTQSSISRQIAALERQVGRKLFIRKTRALLLTPQGERLLQAARQAIAGIDRTVDEIRGVSSTPRVTITTYASFASLWLVPRLAAFQRAHPEIEINIAAGDRFVDLESEGVDIALRWCRPEAAPRDATLLLGEEVTPAVSPALLERSGVSLCEPTDVARLPLLDTDDIIPSSIASSWARWFEFVGLQTPPRPQAGRIAFTFIDQAVQAAIRGQGVVLGRKPLIEDLIASGQLVLPFPDRWMRTGYNYYLIDNRERSAAEPVQIFRGWLAEEFARGPQRQT